MLERLDEGLWVAAMPLSYVGLRLGTRMTIVRLAGGELWIHSPIAPTAGLRAAVDALLEHDFERMVLAHGDVIAGDGKGAVRQTFAFLRGR